MRSPFRDDRLHFAEIRIHAVSGGRQHTGTDGGEVPRRNASQSGDPAHRLRFVKLALHLPVVHTLFVHLKQGDVPPPIGSCHDQIGDDDDRAKQDREAQHCVLAVIPLRKKESVPGNDAEEIDQHHHDDEGHQHHFPHCEKDRRIPDHIEFIEPPVHSVRTQVDILRDLPAFDPSLPLLTFDPSFLLLLRPGSRGLRAGSRENDRRAAVLTELRIPCQLCSAFFTIHVFSSSATVSCAFSLIPSDLSCQPCHFNVNDNSRHTPRHSLDALFPPG